jgi:hypothetical protein
MPLKPRYKPPVLPDMSDRSKNYATCYVDNVYRDLPGVEKGEVKYIRILDQLFWFPGSHVPVGRTTTFIGSYRKPGGTGQGTVRIVGTVPVEEDGSAHFKVPAGVDLYFQALDKDFRGVQRMRTHVEFGPGENRSCVGCHETRGDMAQPPRMGQALEKPAVQPREPFWGDQAFIDYERMIQPVLEKKCVKCHGAEEPKGGLMLTSTKDERGFMQSYRSLFGLGPGQSFPTRKTRRGFKPANQQTWDIMHDKVSFILGQTDGEITQPKQFGSPQAPLGKTLVEDPDHRKLLTNDEMELLMTWLDVRAPYYSQYRAGRKWVAIEPFDPFGENRDHKFVPR